jgi:hypothetical protein
MEDGGDKLNNLADTVYEEEENRTREEVIELSEEVLYNRGNVQNMTQMLLTAEDSDILGRAQLALDGSNEASRSLDSTKGWNPATDSRAGNITGGQPQPKSTRGKTEPGMDSGA